MIQTSLLAGLSMLVLAATSVAASSDGALDRYRGRSRVLAVVAPDVSDPRLLHQRDLYAAMRAGARERDLVLVEGIGESRQGKALRERFGIGHLDFRAVLIGKDGGEKLTSETPLGPDELFAFIDAMPMRQDEMRRRKP